nr:hypothetical protein [Tanacetum cinerariifolium]
LKEKGEWVNGEWRWTWDWVQGIRGRVCSEFDELLGVLQNVVVSNNCRDTWRWTIFEDGIFKVKELSSLIEEKILHVWSAVASVHINGLAVVMSGLGFLVLLHLYSACSLKFSSQKECFV